MRTTTIIYLAATVLLLTASLNAFVITSAYPYLNGDYPYENSSAVSSFTVPMATANLVTSVNPSRSGGVYPPSGSYPAGTSVEISEVPGYGYTFVNWTCAGNGCFTGPLSYGTVAMNNNITETANFKSTKAVFYSFLANANPNIGGSVSPSIGTYLPGTVVNVTAKPALNYGFVNWTCAGIGCYGGTSPTSKVALNSNITEIANFVYLSNNTYVLKTASNPPAGGTVSGAGYYKAGSRAHISAFPSIGYVFTGWSCSGLNCYSGVKSSQNLTMDTNITEIADFQKNQTVYTLTTITNNQTDGSVLFGGNYTIGSVEVISAAAAYRHSFVNWTCAGIGCYSGASPFAVVTLLGNVTETAHFK